MAKKHVVSLDIGSTAIRGIEAEIRNGEPKITNIYSIPIQSQIVDAGRIVDEEGLKKGIERLWKNAKFKSRDVILAIGGFNLQMRIVDKMPWSPEEEFKVMLQYNLRDKVPLDVDDYYFDSHTLREYRSPEDLMVYKKILVSAAEREYVNKIVEIMDSLKLRIIAIDSTPLSLIRAHHLTYDYSPNTVIGLFDIGAEIFTIEIHKNHQPLYQHIGVGLGGNRTTEKIAKELKITTPEAELLKITNGLSEEEISELSIAVPLPNGMVRTVKVSDFNPYQIQLVNQIIAEEVSVIIAHINEILDDFFATSTETMLNGIIMSGGGIMLNGLLPRLASEIIKPTVAKPFGDNAAKKGNSEIMDNQHQFMIPLGALVSRGGY
jgi:type IV pilus assembly protein PilM